MEAVDPIECEIVQGLKAIPAKAAAEQWKSDRIWTHQTKAVVGALGLKHGYGVCTSDWKPIQGSTWGEWLYDMVWVSM